jgi:hypothetical protein
MTDEPREENRPDEEEVEGHGPLGDLEGPLGDKHQTDEDDDVEAHSPGIGPAPSIGPEPTIGP